jgi:hypothetical protein
VKPDFRRPAVGARLSERPRAEQKRQHGQRVGGSEENALAPWAGRSATSQTATLRSTASVARRRSRAQGMRGWQSRRAPRPHPQRPAALARAVPELRRPHRAISDRSS